MPGPKSRHTHLEHPAHSAIWQEPIAPDDAITFAVPTRGLYIATGGLLTVLDPHDHTITYQPGNDAQLPISVVKVFATGTTAGGAVRCGWGR